MKKRIKNIIAVLCIALSTMVFQSCYKEIVLESDSEAVFQAFWDQVNERYVNFEEKGINWDSIYMSYIGKMKEGMTEAGMKESFKEILNYINDLHLSIQAGKTDYLITDLKTLKDEVSGKDIFDYYFPGENRVQSIFSGQLREDVAYLNLSDFKIGPSQSVRSLIATNSFTNGYIIDIRDNHGGSVKMMFELLSCFTPDNFVAGYEKFKTGPGHNDFSDFREIIINGNTLVPEKIRKVVLVNENVFSAGNIFAAFMKGVPNTIIIGTKSSGGAGYPVSVILPNNWVLNIPGNKIYDINRRYLDEGINPDVKVELKEENLSDLKAAGDPVIEKAIEYLYSQRE